jgi:hypothetical protein
MNSRRGIDGGRIVSALGAVLLLVSLFLEWYGFGNGPDADGFSAWTAFELVDLILALLAIAAIAAAFEFEFRGTTRLPEKTGAAAGAAALLLVAVSIINEPPAAQGFDSQLELGAWLGLAGAAVMCAGALLSFNRISLVVTPRDRSATRHAADEPPSESETRPL